jgi:FKBP-type peptidyl-prolyl cis-trans isomerase
LFKYSALCFVTLVLTATAAVSAEAKELKSDKDRLSYSIGASIAINLKKEKTDFDLDLMIKGLKDAAAGKKLAIPEKEARMILGKYQIDLRKRLMKERKQATIDNKQKSDAFLAANKKKKGVETLPGGIQYKIIKQGKGPIPQLQNEIEVNYRGSLIDGTVFDETQPGHPATLKVASLISGWKQAITHMPAGSKWHIVIPPELAYGDRGVGTDIGPNEALVFDVELLSVK